jgi:hypothetical protein
MPPFLASMKKSVPNQSFQIPLGKEKMFGTPMQSEKSQIILPQHYLIAFDELWIIVMVHCSMYQMKSKLTEPG